MPDTRRITMRQLKDVLRLKLELHHSHQRIAEMLGLSKGAVTKYAKLAGAAGLTWQQIQDMDETALQNRLMAVAVRPSSFVEPDYAKLHQELGRKGMTLMLLWQAHAQQHPGQAIHSYSQFCENYRRFAKKLKRSMLPKFTVQARSSLSTTPAPPWRSPMAAEPTSLYLPWVFQATPSPTPRRMKP